MSGLAGSTDRHDKSDGNPYISPDGSGANVAAGAESSNPFREDAVEVPTPPKSILRRNVSTRTSMAAILAAAVAVGGGSYAVDLHMRKTSDAPYAKTRDALGGVKYTQELQRDENGRTEEFDNQKPLDQMLTDFRSVGNDVRRGFRPPPPPEEK